VIFNSSKDEVVEEYLIEQLQYTGAESYSNTSVKSKLSLNHPCKELVWVLQLDSNVAPNKNRWSDYTNSGDSDSNYYAGSDLLASGKLQLNGHDRFDERDAKYFNVVNSATKNNEIFFTQKHIMCF